MLLYTNPHVSCSLCIIYTNNERIKVPAHIYYSRLHTAHDISRLKNIKKLLCNSIKYGFKLNAAHLRGGCFRCLTSASITCLCSSCLQEIDTIGCILRWMTCRLDRQGISEESGLKMYVKSCLLHVSKREIDQTKKYIFLIFRTDLSGSWNLPQCWVQAPAFHHGDFVILPPQQATAHCVFFMHYCLAVLIQNRDEW